MISSPNRSSRGTRPVSLVVIHTAEGATDVTALGNYFARASAEVSSHVGIDDVGVEQYVPYSEEAWTIRSGNPISDNAELCAYAALTRAQWLSEVDVVFVHPQLGRTVTVHRPARILRNTAGWIRERCLARGIPMVKLTPAQVAAGQAGVIGHIDWTLGMHDGTHTDPGDGFPWDLVMSWAAPLATTPMEDDPMTAIPITVDSGRGFQEACGADVGGKYAQAGTLSIGSTYGGTTWKCAALGADGRVLAYWAGTAAAGLRTSNNTSLAYDLPIGTRAVTVEGTVDNAGTRPWACVLTK